MSEIERLAREMSYLRFSLLAIFLVVTSPLLAKSEGHQAILNYDDPHGMALVLGVVQNADQIPTWMHLEPGSPRVTIGVQPAANAKNDQGRGGSAARYLLFSNRLAVSPNRWALPIPGISSDSINRAIVESQPMNKKISGLPLCEAGKPEQSHCRISGVGEEVVHLLLSHAPAIADQLVQLQISEGLTTDDRAVKRVLVELTHDKKVRHVDFVGLVRGKDEQLPAPDAVSVYVVRLANDGEISLVRRFQDVEVDIPSIKFSFEQ